MHALLVALGTLGTCPPPPPRPRAVYLAYTWGSGPSSCSPYFMRSWVALLPQHRANTDLVILWEGNEAPCAGEPAGANARYIKMPPKILAPLKATRLAPAAYRMRAVNWWLSQPDGAGYGWVGVLDTDILFQSDLFDELHAVARTGSEELHLVSESPFELNDGYTNRRLHATSSCDGPLTKHLMRASIFAAANHTPSAATASVRLASAGRALRSGRRGATQLSAANTPPAVAAFWERFGKTHRLNFGSMFGTRAAMMALCEQVVAVLVGPMSSCWDQGMLNVLVWTGLLRPSLPTATRIIVWDCFAGPVKTLDVGGLRDGHGRWYNERGALYALVHQFRKTRQSAFYASLERSLPARAAPGDERSDARYPHASWRARVLPRPMQREPFVWDDARRMEKLRVAMRASGLPDPSDASRPLPPRRPTCLGGMVHASDSDQGQAWPSTGAAEAVSTAGVVGAHTSTVQRRCSAGALDGFTEATWGPCPHVPCALLDHNGTVHGDAWGAMAAAGFVRGAGAGADTALATAPNVQLGSRRHNLGRRAGSSSGGGGDGDSSSRSSAASGEWLSDGGAAAATAGDRLDDGAETKLSYQLTRRAFGILERELIDLARRVKDEEGGREAESMSTEGSKEGEEPARRASDHDDAPWPRHLHHDKRIARQGRQAAPGAPLAQLASSTGAWGIATPTIAAHAHVDGGDGATAAVSGASTGATANAILHPIKSSAKRPVTRPGRGTALWLSAVSMPCADGVSRDAVHRFVATHASPNLHVLVNVFDGETDEAHAICERPLAAAGALRVSYVAGFKPLFWRQELTPERTAAYDLVWLVDCDLRVSPHLFSPAQVEHWMEVSGASIAQPSVLPATKHGRGGRGALTRSGFSADCVVRTMPYVEQMTPVLRHEVWVLVWSALQSVPTARLGSDSGIETLWCGLSALRFPRWPACVALSHQSVVHLNTHTIHRFDKQEREHYFNVRVNLMSYLQAKFAPAMRAALRCPGEPCRKAEAANLKLFPSLQHVTKDDARENTTECWGV